jgi:hypothetical protein
VRTIGVLCAGVVVIVVVTVVAMPRAQAVVVVVMVGMVVNFLMNIYRL